MCCPLLRWWWTRWRNHHQCAQTLPDLNNTWCRFRPWSQASSRLTPSSWPTWEFRIWISASNLSTPSTTPSSGKGNYWGTTAFCSYSLLRRTRWYKVQPFHRCNQAYYLVALSTSVNALYCVFAAQSPMTVSSSMTRRPVKTPTSHWKNYGTSSPSVYYRKLVC